MILNSSLSRSVCEDLADSSSDDEVPGDESLSSAFEPLRKRKRALPNGPLPSFHREAFESNLKRVKYSSRTNTPSMERSLEQITDDTEESVVPFKYTADPMAAAAFYQEAPEALDLTFPSEVHSDVIRLILDPFLRDPPAPAANLSVKDRIKAAMMHINRNARLYTKSAATMVIYKRINAENGIVEALSATIPVFVDMFQSLRNCKVATEDGSHVYASKKEEVRIFGQKVSNARGERTMLWRSLTGRSFEEESRGTAEEIDGWYMNVLRYWASSGAAQVARCITFNPTPPGDLGCASTDVVNLWRGVQHDEEDCKQAYYEEVVYNANDRGIPTYLHEYLQSKRGLVNGQMCYLWREMGTLYELHGLEQISNGSEEANKWIKWAAAHRQRRPHIKSERALCVKGREGIGKTLYFDGHKRLLGPEYCFTTTSSDDVLGDFNDAIVGKILITFEEASADQETAKKLAGHWKRAITDDFVRLRQMYSPAGEHRNFMNFVCLSNLDQMVPWSDRRLAAFETSDDVRSPQYYTALAYIISEHKHPRRAGKAIRAWAYEHIYLGFTDEELELYKRKDVPQTETYRAMLIENLGPADAWIFYRIKNGVSLREHNRSDTLTGDLMEECQAYMAARSNNYVHLCANVCQKEWDQIQSQGDYLSELLSATGFEPIVDGAYNMPWFNTYIRPVDHLGRWAEPSKTAKLETVAGSPPKELWPHTPFVVFPDPSDLRKFTFEDTCPHDRAEQSVTWEDVAYWYRYLVDLETKAKFWDRVVSVDDMFNLFVSDRLRIRKKTVDRNKFQNVIQRVLSSDVAPLETVERQVVVKEGQPCIMKKYWILPTLEQAKINWAGRHYTNITVFDL
jgi:hypothetical protein